MLSHLWAQLPDQSRDLIELQSSIEVYRLVLDSVRIPVNLKVRNPLLNQVQRQVGQHLEEWV